MLCPYAMLRESLLSFRWIFSARKSRCWPQLRPHHLGICARRWRSLRRRRSRLFRQRLAFHQHLHFIRIDYFAFEQSLRDALERLTIGGKQPLRILIAAVDDPLHFLIDLDRRIFRVVAMLRDL